MDSAGIHDLNGITPALMSRFTETMVGLAPVTIAERLRTKLLTIWNEEQIERLINSVDINTPIGKRDYAIIL